MLFQLGGSKYANFSPKVGACDNLGMSALPETHVKKSLSATNDRISANSIVIAPIMRVRGRLMLRGNTRSKNPPIKALMKSGHTKQATPNKKMPKRRAATK